MEGWRFVTPNAISSATGRGGRECSVLTLINFARKDWDVGLKKAKTQVVKKNKPMTRIMECLDMTLD